MPAPEWNPPSEEESGGFDIRKVAGVLLAHKWSILSLTVLVTLIGALLVLRQTPVYRATATLLLERSPVNFSPIQDPYLRYTEHYLYYQTQYGLIKRRAIGERVVEKLGLISEDQPPPPPPKLTGWKSWLPEDWFEKPRVPTFEERRSGLIGSIVGSVNVSPERNSQLVNISADHPDPEMAAKIANAVGEAFIEDNLDGRLEMATKAASYLTDRLSDLRLKLTESEAALQRFRDQENLVDVRGVDSLASQELDLATQKVADARRRLADLETSYQQIQSAKSQGTDFSSVPAIVASPRVQQSYQAFREAKGRFDELALTYGPKHPKLISAQNELDLRAETFNREAQVAVAAIEDQYRSAQAAVETASNEFAGVRDELKALDRKEFTLQKLERDVETNRQIYEKFQTQFKETDAAGGVQTANARVVEQARIPGSPVSPNVKRSIMMALMLGLALSIGLAFLLDYLDNAVVGAEDVEQKLALPALGMLPRLKADEDRLAPMTQFSRESRSNFAEAVRTIRTGVLLACMDEEKQILLVTSSVPGEGKTTLSLNLSRALAEMKKVLLIDADMRRPMVARVLPEGKNAQGLSHYISGEAPLSECVHQLHENLDVIPAGVIPPNPLELLSSLKFSTALANLAKEYDHIVIDCAPALAVSDAMVLSRLATGVVYVVRSQSTPIQAAQSGIKRLKRSGARIIGAVINHATKKARPYYGRYSGYYGESYYSDYGYLPESR